MTLSLVNEVCLHKAIDGIIYIRLHLMSSRSLILSMRCMFCLIIVHLDLRSISTSFLPSNVLLLISDRLLRELQSEGALTAEQSLRVKEWLCSVEEERSGLTTASGPDSGIENSSTEDSVALRRGRPAVRNQVCLYQIFKKIF